MDLSQANITTNMVEAIALHCSTDGHNKDWIGAIDINSVITTWWGVADGTYQTATRKGTFRQFRELITQKTSKRSGYVVVDEYFCSTGWKNNLQSIAVEKPKNTTTPQQTPNNITTGLKAPTTSIGWDF